MQLARPNRLRRAVIYATLATLLGVVALTLSQCTMVGDNVTGVGLAKKQQATCIKACNDQYQLLNNEEKKLNATNIALCAGDPDCLAAEAARHAAALASLIAAKEDCHAACKHQQGVGGAG